jgi:hypothetical protein
MGRAISILLASRIPKSTLLILSNNLLLLDIQNGLVPAQLLFSFSAASIQRDALPVLVRSLRASVAASLLSSVKSLPMSASCFPDAKGMEPWSRVIRSSFRPVTGMLRARSSCLSCTTVNLRSRTVQSFPPEVVGIPASRLGRDAARHVQRHTVQLQRTIVQPARRWTTRR